MIDVAHLITRMIVGGAQENTLLSVLGLASLPEYRAWLVTGPETGPEGNLLEGRGDDLEVVYVPRLIRSINPAADLRAAIELHGVLRSTGPDVVHTHSTKAGVLGRLAARAAGVPVVVHTLHGLTYHDYQPAMLNATYRMAKKAMSPFTDHYVSVADDVRRRAIAAGIGPPARHSTIRSGFQTDDFVRRLVPPEEARDRYQLPHDRVLIGSIGRLFPLKGHAEILAALPQLLRRHPDVLVVFVGSGPSLHDLQERVRDLGLERHVRFLGRVTGEEIPVVLSSLDILVHASLREGLARVIPQGVLAGVPIVCYDLDGSPEVVTDGVNGFLVRPQDVGGLAERLALLAGDEALREKLGGQGREVVKTEFAAEEMVRQLDQLYRRLLAEHEDSGPRRRARRAAALEPRR